MTDFDLSKYIYWEFSVAVLFGTELIRFYLSKIHGVRFIDYISIKEPKWVTLFVAIILGVLDWLFIGGMNSFHPYQKIISFAIAVLGYDYVWKIFKDQFGNFVTFLKERKKNE